MAAASPPSTIPDQPHLVSLVLQSKKALLHGQQLSSRAHAQFNASAQVAVDVLALDAKVRWISEAVIEQLKLAASVAKSIDEKRGFLGKRIQDWDASRLKHSDALDSILESLGAQLVPPEFHQSSEDSSLFGSQISESAETNHKPQLAKSVRATPPKSPSATLRNQGNGSVSGEKDVATREERKKWKNLRDFVDDRAIEDVIETIESGRNALDDIIGKTDDYPETLNRTIMSIQASLPEQQLAEFSPMVKVEETLTAQYGVVSSMADLLESLASHYDQMAGALTESEAGEAFSEEDLQDMRRDTDELPAIMAELEESALSIDRNYDHLAQVRAESQKDLDHLNIVLDDLDELGEIMTEMLQTQDYVEVHCEEELITLHGHLLALEQFYEHFVAYQTAYSKLVLEISRRKQYRDSVESIVRSMTQQLGELTDEENRVRSRFNDEYGKHLPEDICLCIRNSPTKWEVVPWEGDTPESLPHIDEDLIIDARNRIKPAEEGAAGVESV